MRKFALLLLIFAFSGVSAFPQVINEILKRMEAHSKALRTFEADITINKLSAQSNETSIKEGRLRFLPEKSGYSLRIDSTKPVLENFSIVNDQFVLYQPNSNPFYLPNTGIAYTGAVTDAQKNLLWIFSILTNSPRANWKRYFSNIQYSGQENLSNTTPVWHLVLKPKNAALYRKIDLWIDGNGMPRQSELTENNGDRTTVLLGNMKKNERITPGIFQIKLPKGTKIIKE